MNGEWLVALLLVIGVLFTLLGSLALILLPDFHSRLHGPSKASTLGLLALLLASALHFGANGQGSWHELLIVLMLFIAAPIGSAVLAQAALRRNVPSVADVRHIAKDAGEPGNSD
ncbi:MAG: hypothetical protein RL210_2348 [Pseudomonadota bacterium]|jgi:multicomponent K+:H+ antiporter subunit G